VKTRSILTPKNPFTLSVIPARRPRQKSRQLLLSVSDLFISIIISSARLLHVTILTTLLCRMKSLKCKRKEIFDTGFIDPNRVNERMVHDNPKETEDNLLWFLEKQEYQNIILFAYNFK
jgi:hypothetical protein